MLINVHGVIFSATLGVDGSLIPLCTEPTLTIVSEAIESGNYSVVNVDQQPPNPPSPDWAAWQLGLLTDPSIVSELSKAPGILLATLTTLLGGLVDKPENLPTILVLWESIRPLLSDPVLNKIAQISEACHLPPDVVAAMQ